MHGVTTREAPTPAFAVRKSPSAVPFIVGTAPKGPVNEIEKIGSFKDAADTFGQRQPQDDTWDFTLLRFAELFFQFYGASPAYFVNVLDPSVHKDNGSQLTGLKFSNGKLTLERAHILAVTSFRSGTTEYDEGIDYKINTDTGVITRIESGSIPAGESMEANYSWVGASMVAASDVVGGVSGGSRTGLELIEEVLPTFGGIPNLILAPGYSQESSVASVIEGKAGGFSGGFKAHGLIDINSGDSNFDEVSEAVQEKGSLTASPDMSVYWPRVTSGEHTDWLSAHAAGVIARTDVDKGGGLPYYSPSNESLSVDGTEVTVTRQEAQTLSDNGLVTAFRTGGGTGFVLWNNNTAGFPSTTDVKDRFIPNSRMATHIANTIVLSIFQKVDEPVNRRLISSVVTSLNQAFNGWEAQGALLGATVQFLEQDNPITELQNGSITFRLFYAAPTPANEIEVVLEVDVDQYKALFH